MADEVKTEAALTPAETENKLLNDNRTITMRRRVDPARLVPLPGGRRVDARKYARVRYTLRAEAGILGDAESMLTDDWKREHPGWRYSWPIRQSNQTASFIRAGWYTPVPFEAINEFDPMAAVGDITTPGGKYIVWKQHLLVAIPPAKWDVLVTQWEDLAINRLDNQADEVSEALERAGGGVYDADVNLFKDPKAER